MTLKTISEPQCEQKEGDFACSRGQELQMCCKYANAIPIHWDKNSVDSELIGPWEILRASASPAINCIPGYATLAFSRKRRAEMTIYILKLFSDRFIAISMLGRGKMSLISRQLKWNKCEIIDARCVSIEPVS